MMGQASRLSIGNDGQDETVSEFIFVSRLRVRCTIRLETDQARQR
jgi:hypothetical protein